MSVSNECSDEFLKRLKVDNKEEKKKRCTNHKSDKENNAKDMNGIKDFETKKYKFIPAFKVAEVVRAKREEEEKNRGKG
jgi:hypothetical protein